MKKVLVLTFILFMAASGVYAADNAADTVSVPPQTAQSPCRTDMKNRGAAFEKRLGLTEAQKAKARELRMKGHEKLKPVLDEINNKKQEAKMVKLSRIAVWAQEEKLAKLDKEIASLEKKANQIRRANMKEFESILTKDQRKILKQMKKEGRQRYERRKAAENSSTLSK